MNYIKSETGQLALKDRSLLTPRQRSAFILFDGKRSLHEVLQATAGLGVTQDDMEQLVERGLLTLISPASGQQTSALTVQAAAAGAAAAGGASAIERYKRAYPLATQLTAALGLKGFRLNLAVEGAGNLEDLMALVPKLRQAAGPEKCMLFERALNA